MAHRTREIFYLLLLVYYKRYNWGTAQQKRCTRPGTVMEGHRASMPFLAASLSVCSPTWQLSEHRCLGVLTEMSSLRPARFINNLQFLFPPQRLGEGGWKSRLLIKPCSFWWPAPILKLSRSSPRVTSLKTKMLLCPGNSKGFRSSMWTWGRRPNIRTKDTPTITSVAWKISRIWGVLFQEPGTKTKVYFLLCPTFSFLSGSKFPSSLWPHLTWLHLQGPYCQIRSHSQVPKVRTSVYLCRHNSNHSTPLLQTTTNLLCHCMFVCIF